MLALVVLCLSEHSHAKLTKGNVIREKYAAYIIDATSGRTLYRKNENKRLHPASLTKLMTLLMVFDALESGGLGLRSRVYISRHAASMSPSKLNLPAGSTIRVEDAILALVTKSANDVAVALAEKLGSTERNFANMMTRKARRIGMKNTRFKNASGLHHPKQISTARDMGVLARVLITDYKAYYHYFSAQSFTYNDATYKNHNKLMKTYEGMDGMKTGYIKASGFNLIASAVRGNHRLIGVIFGGRTGNSRNAQMKKLMDNAFNKVGGVYILAEKIPVPERKPGVTSNAALLRNITTAQNYAAANTAFSKWDLLDPENENSMFNKMSGEGDYDITVHKRIETGLIAISAQLDNVRNKEMIHRTDSTDSNIAKIEPAAAAGKTPKQQYLSRNNAIKNRSHGKWSIQVGAFTSRARTEKALSKTLKMLPHHLGNVRKKVAPLKTAQGWIYRARFEGYSKKAAKDACNIILDCITLSPANR